MLEAVARGKARVERLTGGDRSERREDLVTSAVFGPLMMLPSAGRGLQAMLGVPLAEAESVDIALWPRFGKEPDVVITARFSDSWSVCVLVEVKWGAPLGSEQIENYVELLTAHGQAPGHVVLLGYEPHHENALPDAETKIGRSVVRRSWRDVTRVLQRIADPRDGVGIWAGQVGRFLQRTEKGHLFSGFGHLGIRLPQAVRLSYQTAGAAPWLSVADDPGAAAYTFSKRRKLK